ncbi:hypothetical protein BF49_7380 [Bradyrhizobium sp.]|nr:hypothetical protein BF49_7380 [Bradyrhizobium sp.]
MSSASPSGSEAIDFDPLDRGLHRLAIAGSNLHGAVVLDVDLGAGLLDDLTDHLAAGADHFADLVGGNLEGLDARCVFAELGAGVGERLRHLAEDVDTPILGLAERDLHDLLGDALDLDVHLERGDALLGTGDLEVHVAEMVLVTENVRENREALVFEDQAHRDARGRPLQRHAGVHQRERGAADRCHRRGAVGFGDLRHHARGVGEFVVRRQHRVDRAPGELAVADLAALGAAEAAGLTDRVGREVVVQQERLFVRSRQRVDVLLVLAGAERGHDQSLGLAAGEQRRAVGARQHADFGDDVAHGLGIAAVDALAGVENVPANDLGFELLEHAADAQLVVFRLLAFREVVRDHLLLDLADRGVAILLDRDGVGGAQFLLDHAEHFLFECRIVDRGDLARLLRGLFGELDDRVDHRLEVAVTEHHGAEHDLFVQLLGFRFHHQHGVRGAGDDEVELGIDHLVERRVEDELVIGEADARGADRALEGSARQGQRSRRGHQRDDIRIVLHVVREHGDDHLGLVAPAVDEQRTDRTVDQA